MKATIVGIEAIEKIDKETGASNFNYNLHVMRDIKKGAKGISGYKVETIWVPFDIEPDVVIGSYCDFDFDIVQTKSGSFTRLDSIEVLGNRRIDIGTVVKNAGK